MTTHEPDGVSPTDHVSTLLARFEDERPEVSRPTAEELLAAVERHPTVAANHVDDLARWVAAGRATERAWALRTLETLAHERPDAVRDRVGPIHEVLADRDAEAREEAAAVLGVLARAHPDAVVPAVPNLHDLLNEPDRSGQIQALVALEAVAATNLHAVVPAFRRICRLLESEDEAVRELATACVATAGISDPLVVEQAGDRFTDRLADPIPEVRARAYHAAVSVALSYPGSFERPAAVAATLDDRHEEFGDVGDETLDRATTTLRALA